MVKVKRQTSMWRLPYKFSAISSMMTGATCCLLCNINLTLELPIQLNRFLIPHGWALSQLCISLLMTAQLSLPIRLGERPTLEGVWRTGWGPRVPVSKCIYWPLQVSLDLHSVQNSSLYEGKQGHATLTRSWKNVSIVKALLTCLLNALSSSKEHGCHHCRDKRPLSLYL